MADARRFVDLRNGHAGRLVYRPRRGSEDDLGQLLSTRILSGFPHLQPLGEVSELYPPSKSEDHDPTYAKLHTERNLQRRWLFHSHPEAFMATDNLPEQLSYELNHFKKLEETPISRPLLAVGDITDTSDPSRQAALPVMACATGESGELLRLVRIHDTQWQWEGDTLCTLHVPTVDLEDFEDEAIWTSDGLPISQIKFAARTVEHNTLRYIIVQRETSTVILQPQYRKIPVLEKATYHSVSTGVSRIDPNPIISLTHHQTGGNAHSDVVFIPGLSGTPRQLCIIDECGYWTLWNMTGVLGTGRNTTRLELVKAGHIIEGPLDEIPPVSPHPAQKHGAVLVGAEPDPDSWSLSDADTKTHGLFANLKQQLLVYNSERWTLFDLLTGEMRPSIVDWSSRKSKFGSIIDVQLSPVDPNHVFILTTKFVVWVDIFSYSEYTMTQRPVILLTCAYRSTQGLEVKMTVCRSSSSNGDDTDAMVLLYNSLDRQLHSFIFRLSPQNPPQFHLQTTCLPTVTTKEHQFSPESLHLQPLTLDVEATSSLVENGQDHSQIQFFQSMLLGKDFQVCQNMWFAAINHTTSVDRPSIRLSEEQHKVDRQRVGKGKKLERTLGRLFSVPDEMVDIRTEDVAKAQRITQVDRKGESAAKAKRPRPVVLNFDRISQALRRYLASRPQPGSYELPRLLADSIQRSVLHGVGVGQLPLVTWQDIVDNQPGIADAPSATDFEVEDGLRELMDQPDYEAVLTYLGARLPGESHDALVSFSHLKRELCNIWLEPFRETLSEAGLEKREAWLAALAKDIFLSTHGAVVQNIPLFGQTDTSRGFPGSQAPSSSRMMSSSQLQSSQVPSPQPSRSDIPSSPPSSIASPAAAPDAAIQRLQLLAPSLQPGKLGALDAAPVLSHWPSKAGVSTAGYVSSVTIATEKKFEGARERIKRIERKRKHMAEKYKLPPGHSSQKPNIQESDFSLRPEAPTIKSSQPPIPQSSQSQGMIMSQPAGGAFGDRKKAKLKKKKKSGFR